MSPDEFLDEWPGRLRVSRGLPPTIETLRRITRLHQDQFPFENIEVLCGGVPSLKLADLVEKLIRNRRGGYCFELNALLGAGLAALGFQFRPLMARVMWERDTPGPRTHAFLLVEAGATSWLVDVGFGGPGPIEPIETNVGGPPTVIDNTAYRLKDRVSLGIVLERRSSSGSWTPLYAFGLERIDPDELAAGNRLAATMPGSIFRRGLKIARQSPGFRVTLNGLEFKRYAGTILVEAKKLGAADTVDCLTTDFGIQLSLSAERALVARLFGET